MGTCCPSTSFTRNPTQGGLLTRSLISKKSRLESIYSSYKFLKVIGYGQFGTVRKAIKTTSNKQYAIKSISKAKAERKFNILKRELEILSIIDHPNIIKLHEIYEDEKYLHLVLDLCKGGDLYDYILNKGSLNEKDVIHIMRIIFSAVNHLHTVNICHRDLKPENFLLSSKKPDSEVKLADFGMSVRFSNDEMHTIVGTPYYIAPEVYMGTYGKECDV